MTDRFTELFKIYIDNDKGTYDLVKDIAKQIIASDCDYPVIELADFLEENIFDYCCTCSDENYLLVDMIDAAKCEIDFDGLAKDYIDEVKEEA